MLSADEESLPQVRRDSSARRGGILAAGRAARAPRMAHLRTDARFRM